MLWLSMLAEGGTAYRRTTARWSISDPGVAFWLGHLRGILKGSLFCFVYPASAFCCPSGCCSFDASQKVRSSGLRAATSSIKMKLV